MSYLPENWRSLELSKVLKVKHGKNQKEVECEKSKYPILGSGGLMGYASDYLWDKPSVLIGRKGTINKPQFMEKPFWTVDTLFYTDIFDGYEAKWLFYVFQTINWLKYNEASGVPSLSASTIGTIKIMVPPFKEQNKIAKILSTWDRAIELKEEILDNYKKQKTYYQQIIYSERSLRNRIQVKNVKLRKFIRESKNNNKKLLISNVLSVTNSQGFVLQTDHFSKSVASKITSNYKIVKKNEFAYNPSRINVGSIDMLTSYDAGLLSPLYVVFNTTEGLEPRYLFHYLKSSRFVRRIPSYVQGSVRDSLTYSALQAMPIPLPEIEYQKKIAVFFDKLDHLIQTLSVEIKASKEQKKGLIQQLLTGKIRVQS